MTPDAASQYLEQIAADDPDLHAEVKKYFLSFDDLLTMPQHLMNNFWKNPDIDVDELAKAFKLRGVPTTILIDKEGYEFARIIGYIDFENKSLLEWLSKQL